MMKENSLCWSCERATSERLCPWVGGKAVKGWEAEPTVLTHQMNGVQYTTNSYQVKSCPLYKEDYKQVTVVDIAKVLGISHYEVRSTSTKTLRAMLKDIGIDLRTERRKYLRDGQWLFRRICYLSLIHI